MIWFVGSLLLSAYISPSLSGEVNNGVVDKIIAKSKQYCRENNITAIELEAFAEKPVEFGRGWLSGLDDLENFRDPIIDSRPYRGGFIYYYNLGLAMKKMKVNYPFKIVLPDANTTGTFSIDGGIGEYHADGHVFNSAYGNCKAVLENVYLYKMENSKGHIDSKDIPAPEIRELYEDIINKVITKQIYVEVSYTFDLLLKTPEFQKIFNDTVCSAI